MLPDVYDAATLQKSRSQDLTSALIRGGSLQLQQPEKPPARLLSGERAPLLPAVELSFHPQICKPGRVEVGYSEHLRERVAQSRILDDELKADCLERLVGVAQRAPMVRRLSWSQQLSEEEVPESDEEECVLSRLEEDGVALVRRRSGGGAVFQDAGCSVFTFIFPSSDFHIDRNLDTVLGPHPRGQEDLRQRIQACARPTGVTASRDRLDRYGFDGPATVFDTRALELSPQQLGLHQESFPDLTHQQLCDALIEEFRERHGASEPLEEVTQTSELTQAQAFKEPELVAELSDRSWRLGPRQGKTPEFSHQFETRIDGVGVFDVHLKVVQGVIEDATIFSDALFPDVISQAMHALKGREYGRDSMRKALLELQPQFLEEGPRKSLDAMTEWMISNVIEITKEDLLKDDPPEDPVLPEAVPPEEQEASSKGFDPSRRSVMEAELREVLTPTPELLERAKVASSSHSERHSLGNLLAQNQHLAARAGLSSWGECTWRPAAPDAENGTGPQSGRRGVAAGRSSASRRSGGGQEVDFYSGWEHRSPHWHFRPRYGGKAVVSTKSSRTEQARHGGLQGNIVAEGKGSKWYSLAKLAIDSPMTLWVAMSVTLLSLGVLAQFTGIMTVRTRLRSAVFATPEDTATIKSKVQPIDLRLGFKVNTPELWKIFLFLLDFFCCLCSRCRRPMDVEAPAEQQDLEAALVRCLSAAVNQENNVTVGMIFMALYVTQQRCLSKSASSCDPDPVVTEVFIYLYLAMRLIHFFIYLCSIRQPYRAIAFISTNVCLTGITRQVIAWLVA
eukprot:s1272_g2.t1